MPYLLDTNIVSNIAREPFGKAALKVLSLRGEVFFISIVVLSELRFGIAKSGSTRATRAIEALLPMFRVVPLEEPADVLYGALRADLERSGRLIGPNDLFIAAQCLALDLTLVSDNEGEFSRVPGLRLENWLR